MLQIYVSELNYVLDQNKKPQNDADSISPPSVPSVSRKFCPFYLYSFAIVAICLLSDPSIYIFRSNAKREWICRSASLVAGLLCQPLWMVGQPTIQIVGQLPWFQAQGHSWENMASSRRPSLDTKAAWITWPGSSREWSQGQSTVKKSKLESPRFWLLWWWSAAFCGRWIGQTLCDDLTQLL